MDDTNWAVYRILKASDTTMSLVDDNIDDPSADTVIIWENETGGYSMQHGDKIYHTIDIRVSGLDLLDADHFETTAIVGGGRYQTKPTTEQP